MSETFPPSPPKQRTKPRPKGTVVTGHTQSGIFGFPTHKDHGLFSIASDPVKADWSNSGYQQDVICVTCGTEIVMVDSEFLMVKATKAQVQQAMRDITKCRNILLAARRQYSLMIEEGRVK